VTEVIGLDVSLRGLGVCIVNGDPRQKVGDGLDFDSALFRAGEDVDGPRRLSVVSNAVWSWLDARDVVGPGRVYVMEGYGFASQQAHSLGEIGGCIRKMIWESGGNLVVIPPATLKRFLTGKGTGDKNIVMKWLFKRWGFDEDEDNQCDAFGCAVVGLIDLHEDDWSKMEHDILTKKVERYAGQGQKDWHGGGSTRKVAGRSGRRARGRADLGSALLKEDVQGTQRGRRDGSRRGAAPKDWLPGVE
jgi:crossover junction endodeoxyribonuclease RuvC